MFYQYKKIGTFLYTQNAKRVSIKLLIKKLLDSCLVLTTIILFSGCYANHEKLSQKNVSYARLFNYQDFGYYTVLQLYNNSDTTAIFRQYVLVPQSDTLPANLPDGIIIRTPIERLIVYDALHCAVISALHADTIIVGVSESQHLKVETLKTRFAEGKLQDIGMIAAPNIEKIITISPDVILCTFVEGNNYGKVTDLGIPFVEAIDYLENTPLGRAEWIKFFGLLLNKQALADSLFQNTVKEYLQIKQKVATINNKPSLLPETLLGSTWYVPGGKSYTAVLYADAGANYIWSEDVNTGSIPMSFENVLSKAQDADIWILKYNNPEMLTYGTLLEQYKGYSLFKAFQHKKIFACNTYYAKYYEHSVLNPHLILKDLSVTIHPENFPNESPIYFLPLQ